MLDEDECLFVLNRRIRSYYTVVFRSSISDGFTGRSFVDKYAFALFASVASYGAMKRCIGREGPIEFELGFKFTASAE